MRVRIYMKSGNVITLRGVKDVMVSRNNITNDISSLEIEREWYMKYLPCERLYGAALVTSQIEAITCNK